MANEVAYEELATIHRMGQISTPHHSLLQSILNRLTVLEDQAQPVTTEPATKASPSDADVCNCKNWLGDPANKLRRGAQHLLSCPMVSITVPTQPSPPSAMGPASPAANSSECVHWWTQVQPVNFHEGASKSYNSIQVRCSKCHAVRWCEPTHVLTAAQEPSSISTSPRLDSPPSVASSLSAAARSLSGSSKSWAVDEQPDGWRVSNGTTGLGAFTSWAGAANCAAMLNVHDDLPPHPSQFHPPSTARSSLKAAMGYPRLAAQE